MTDLTLTRPAHAPRAPILPRLLAMLSLYRQRRSLADLDDHLLADIGITRDQALAEAARPVWDAPTSWTA